MIARSQKAIPANELEAGCGLDTYRNYFPDLRRSHLQLAAAKALEALNYKCVAGNARM
jgi:hypothetical protein